MKQRMNAWEAAPEAFKLMLEFEKYVKTTGFDPLLVELVKIRASQINGCAYCLNMHTRDARKLGETEQRIYCLNAWAEAPFYSEEERAALALTEAVTLIADEHVSDELYEHAREYFNEKQYIDLVIMINTINSWNRMAIATTMLPD